MKISEHANYLLNEYGRLQFDYAAYCKPDGESLRNEARNNLEEYIAELEAENERLSQFKAIEAENAKLRDVIGDYRDGISRVLDEKCPTDERHCGCVPILRDQLNKYQKALVLITTMPELSQAINAAKEALQERGKFIWTEQSVGEYWVTKLDILQDRFDALEKDYADVCQKRLEAADVFSRQIIELEAENAELKAERRWIPVSERLPEDGETVFVIIHDGFERFENGNEVARLTYLGNGNWWSWKSERYIVTHWMPLPESPNDTQTQTIVYGKVCEEMPSKHTSPKLAAKVNCRDIAFGSYDCYEETKYGVSVDGCLVEEINRLNNNGIKTIGCCCGHGKAQGYIQVSPEFVQAMLTGGYEQLPLDKYGNGLWCFRPKAPLPELPEVK